MKTFRAPALAAASLLVFTATASAHARVSPAVSVAKQLQLYSLAVPTEKSHSTTTKVEMTAPAGFSIDSFVASPGWRRTTRGSRVTWSGGHTPTGEDSLFQFLAQPSDAKAYTFGVQQTYSDGSVVDWSGSESSADPAPTIEVKSSLGGGGGTSALTIVALIVGLLGLAAGGFALASGGRGGRSLA
jgi:uncharacterized protein YcnI